MRAQLFSGKVAVVTGAGSGIGRAASITLFAAEGAKVIAVDKTTDAVNETAARVKAAKGTAQAVAADAGSEADVAAFIAKAIADFGGLDVIWANAGISGGLVPLHDQTVEQWNEILRVNLIGPFLAVKHASLQMMKQGHGGSIICTASVAGLKANAGGNPYSASKAGVISLVQTSSYSLTGSGIRVNAICPGLIETGMTRNTIREGARTRHGGQDRPDQPDAARRRAARDRGDGPVSGERRGVLRQRPGFPGRRRPDGVDAVRGQAEEVTEAIMAEWRIANGFCRKARSPLFAARHSLLASAEARYAAPAFTAYSHDAFASGTTRAALSDARALDAVPSRMRPAIPCRMQVRRNRL